MQICMVILSHFPLKKQCLDLGCSQYHDPCFIAGIWLPVFFLPSRYQFQTEPIFFEIVFWDGTKKMVGNFGIRLLWGKTSQRPILDGLNL